MPDYSCYLGARHEVSWFNFFLSVKKLGHIYVLVGVRRKEGSATTKNSENGQMKKLSPAVTVLERTQLK